MLIKAFKLFYKIKNLKDIELLKYKDILIGDLIYDSYIRLYDKSPVPQKNFTLFKLIFTSLELYWRYNFYFKNNKSEICIAGDKCYLFHGIFLRIALNFSSRCFYFTGRTLKPYNDPSESLHKHHPNKSIDYLEREFKKLK